MTALNNSSSFSSRESNNNLAIILPPQSIIQNILLSIFPVHKFPELLLLLHNDNATDKLSAEEISREEYDKWRYHYPEFDTTKIWAKVPSLELSDALVEAFKDHLKDK